MKKLIVVIMLLGGGIIFSSNANKPIENIASFETCISQNVVFRSTQRLKANDGRQMWKVRIMGRRPVSRHRYL